MVINKQLLPALLSAAGMGILILDSKTALNGVAEGIDLCLKVVIPSLFPFLILSTILTESTFGMNLRFLQPLCRLCRIPIGAAPLLLVGLIGGYPVGAQCVTRAWENGQLSSFDAKRMLGFCNNAGPAFIFGMTAGLFDSPMVPWVLWLIQIVAVIIAAVLLSGDTDAANHCTSNHTLSPAAVLSRAITAMASICGWVIVFRTVCIFCDKWLLGTLSPTLGCLITGIMELTNGCCRLTVIPVTQLRFILCSIFLSFGGAAVYMQTLSVTKSLGTGAYLPGKLIQTAVSAFLAAWISPILFPAEQAVRSYQILPSALLIVVIFAKIFQFMKNNSRNITTQGV